MSLFVMKFLNQSSEFKGWFLVFGCLPRFFIILGLFLLFLVGLKVLQFSFHGRDFMQFLWDFREKSGNIRTGFCLKTSVVDVCDSKTMSCQSKQLDFLKNGCSLSEFCLVAKSKWAVDLDSDVKSEEIKEAVLEDVENEEKERNVEDGEFDVIALRKLVKIERSFKNAALVELEKERMAAATAAEEAMAMILRLQSEKSAVEIRANQFLRITEQRQQYDQGVIESLQRIIMECESERSLTENCVSDGEDRSCDE